jgi:hypothetical protein
MKATLKPNEQVVLQILTRAATLGDVAPKNAYIAQSLGCSTASTGAAIVARLEAKGLIRVHRFNDSRVIEIVANTPPQATVSYYKLRTDAAGRGLGAFDRIDIYTFAEGSQGHGLGCGDIAGNGRMDIILCHGWLEAPADPARGTWIWHGEFADAPWGAMASIPMLVVDVDGDGRNELITGNAHGYGLWWSKRREDGTWAHHPIDPGNAQYHDLHWVDIDGDGACELVTGKRHRAHNGNDVGEWDDVGMYYFKWSGEGFVKQIVDYGPIGRGKGCGIHFAVADVFNSGRLDIVAPGKDGLYIFLNLGSAHGK